MKSLKITVLLAFIALCSSAFGQWNPDPSENNLVCAVDELKGGLRIVSDGNNGAFLFWSDRRHLPDLGNIYGQHIGADGNINWEEEARPFCLADRIQMDSFCVTDGQGGAFLVWRDARSSITSGNTWEFYAQHINASGEATWAENGIPISGPQVSAGVVAAFEHSTMICEDDNGGFIFSWTQKSTLNNSNDCFAQRVDINGNLLWNDGNPLPVRIGDTHPKSIQVLADGEGGVYIVHTDSENGFTNGIRAHRVNSEGVLLWGENGVEPVWDITMGQFHASLAVNDELFLAWEQNPSPNSIRAQLVNPSGLNLWPQGGVDVLANGNILEQPRVAADEFGLYVICLKTEIFKVAHAQKLSYQGELLWGESAVPITLSEASHQFQQIAPDGLGGAVVHFLVNSVVGPDGDPSTLLSRKLNADGSFYGDPVLISNSVPNPGVAKSNVNVIPLINDEYLMAWMTGRPPFPIGSRQIYASKFSHIPYEITNVADNNELENVSIYPNPAQTHFRIENLGFETVDISVFDNSGRSILREENVQDYLNVNIFDWNAGMYIVKFENDKNTYFKKLIVY